MEVVANARSLSHEQIDVSLKSGQQINETLKSHEQINEALKPARHSRRAGIAKRIDWHKLKAEYVSSGLSLDDLSEKHGLAKGTLGVRSSADKWTAGRQAYRERMAAKRLARQEKAELTQEEQLEITPARVLQATAQIAFNTNPAEVATRDRLTALNFLGKHLHLWDEKNVTVNTFASVNVGALSQADCAELLAAIEPVLERASGRALPSAVIDVTAPDRDGAMEGPESPLEGTGGVDASLGATPDTFVAQDGSIAFGDVQPQSVGVEPGA